MGRWNRTSCALLWPRFPRESRVDKVFVIQVSRRRGEIEFPVHRKSSLTLLNPVLSALLLLLLLRKGKREDWGEFSVDSAGWDEPATQQRFSFRLLMD